MLALRWKPAAQDDLAEIIAYIESHNAKAAYALYDSIVHSVERLPDMPYLFRPGRVAGTREYVVHPNYIVVYRVGVEAIEILRVLHSRERYP